jgi:RNase P subunit RPR2
MVRFICSKCSETSDGKNIVVKEVEDWSHYLRVYCQKCCHGMTGVGTHPENWKESFRYFYNKQTGEVERHR